MSNQISSQISSQIAHYSISEEIANAITHGLGVAAAIVALTLMLVKGIPVLSGTEIAAVSVYGASLIILFLASTLYHAITHSSTKSVLKRIDHCAIFFLIAGTYTPLLIISLDSVRSQVLFYVIWAAAFTGILLKAIYINKFKRLSLIMYLMMGWASVILIYEIYQNLPFGGFLLLISGGLAFSLGVPFYIAKKTRYTHAIWHVFVLAGAVCHCLTISLYVIPSSSV